MASGSLEINGSTNERSQTYPLCHGRVEKNLTCRGTLLRPSGLFTKCAGYCAVTDLGRSGPGSQGKLSAPLIEAPSFASIRILKSTEPADACLISYPLAAF